MDETEKAHAQVAIVLLLIMLCGLTYSIISGNKKILVTITYSDGRVEKIETTNSSFHRREPMLEIDNRNINLKEIKEYTID